MRIANVVLNDFTRDNRVLKVSTSLVSKGHSVSVVALHNAGLPRRESFHEGFDVHRVRLFMPTRLLRGSFKLLELALKIALGYRRFDAWHCNDAEAFAIGLLAKFTRPGLKLIYDCHEFEAERNGKSAGYLKGVGWLERNFIRFAEEVIVVSPSIRAAYEDRYGNHGLPTLSLVRNVPGVLTKEASDRSKASGGRLRKALGLAPDAFIALYQGAFTINRGIEELLELADQLSATRIHLVFMGYGLLEEDVRAAADASSNVHFQPAVSYDQLLSYTCDADVGLVSVRPICLSYLYCLPNKLFECIQAGVPVLVNELPDCVELIEAYGIGRVVRGESPLDWLHALAQLAEESPSLKVQSQEGFMQAQSELNWEAEQQELIAIYERLTLNRS
mgnify:CR=1 FL=1